MPWTEIVVDASVGRIGQRSARVPEGYYLLELGSLEPTPEDLEAGKKPGYRLNLRIVESPDHLPNVGIGGELPDFINMGTANSMFPLGNLLAGFGFTEMAKQLEARSKAGNPLKLPTYQAFVALGENLAQRMVGKRTVGLIGDRVGTNGKTYSEIQGMYPPERWAEFRRSQVVSAPTAPQAVSPTNGTATSAADLFADLDSALT